MKNSINLSDITLVILSHNRQHCLKNTLPFYAGTNLQILVLDNSPKPLEDRYITKNCQYLNLNESFSQRSKIAAQLINTPYTVIGADDEIYLPSALEKMRNFLVENNDYVAVGGIAIAVWKYGPSIAASWAYRKTFKYHNNHETPYERIKMHTGNGLNPLTSFFTCNLTRSWAAQQCLNMYSQAPVLATDAISVLAICGAGKSKYLDQVYWIRNWNQSPKSHSGWNRKELLNSWWADENNSEKKLLFSKQLEKIYAPFSKTNDFLKSWELIIESDKVLRRKQSFINSQIKLLGEKPSIKYIKYTIKKLLAPTKMPYTIDKVIEEMKNSDCVVNVSEVSKAAEIVSGLLPYESW